MEINQKEMAKKKKAFNAANVDSPQPDNGVI